MITTVRRSTAASTSAGGRVAAVTAVAVALILSGAAVVIPAARAGAAAIAGTAPGAGIASVSEAGGGAVAAGLAAPAGVMAAVGIRSASNAGGAAATADLPVLVPGDMISGEMSSSYPDAYVFRAATPGVLTLVTASEPPGAQIYLRLPDGTDLAGPAERIDVDLPVGEYVIQMFHFGGYTPTGDGQTLGGTEISVAYELAAAWLPMAVWAPPSDVDGGPDRAQPLAIDERREVGAGEVGDIEDWYLITAPGDGTLTVDTEALGPPDFYDVSLELYAGDDPWEPVASSAQDIDGLRKRESASLAVVAGQLVHARVVGTYQGFWPRAENYVIWATFAG